MLAGSLMSRSQKSAEDTSGLHLPKEGELDGKLFLREDPTHPALSMPCNTAQEIQLT